MITTKHDIKSLDLKIEQLDLKVDRMGYKITIILSGMMATGFTILGFLTKLR